MKPLRIGNVELKTYKMKDGTEKEEIVLWYPNSLYGNEKKYIEDGWESDGEGGFEKDGCHMNSSCFKDRENCYTVADIEWNGAHDEFDVKSIGTRAFNLGACDFRDFKEVLELLEKYSGEDYSED